MATDSNTELLATPQSQGETAATHTNDPFVDQSAPRPNSGSLAALVAAIQQVRISTMATQPHLLHATNRLEHFILQFLHFEPSPDPPSRSFARASRWKVPMSDAPSFAHTLTGRATSAATNDGL